MKKSFLISAFAMAALLCSCSDDKPKDPEGSTPSNEAKPTEPVKPVVEEIAATDSTPALWSIDGVKWLKEEKEEQFPWSAGCPDNYRIPTMEEFKQLTAILPELSNSLGGYSKKILLEDFSTKDSVIALGEESYWWTANTAPMNAAAKSENEQIAVPNVIAAKLAKGGTSLEFVEMPFDVSMRVRCIQDTNTIPVYVNANPMNVDSIKGYISEVTLTPYYEDSFENMGCADCCCEEGNGAKLSVNVNTENGEKKQFEVLELNSKFCGTVSKEIKGVATPIVDQKNGCLLPEIQNFSFLQLFQPGVKVKQSSCRSQIYVTSEVGDEYNTVSCGDSISLNFTARLQEKALLKQDNPGDEKVCSYVFKMADTGKEVQTEAPCSNADINEVYDIETTIILEAITGKDRSPIFGMPYPCCYGEVSTYQLTNINFTKHEGEVKTITPAVVASK